VAGLSRQAYYQGCRERARRACDEEAILAVVRAERRIQPRVGTRKLLRAVRNAGLPVGRDRLFAVLRQHDLLVVPKKKFVRTTYRDESLPVYRNLLYDLEPTRPNHVWVSDLTYIDTNEGNVYLALVTDLVSRKIVGWCACESLGATTAIAALERALQDLPADHWPILHSDRGCQYCCHEYVAVARQRGLPISMTEQNHCYENCYAERVNGILKNEFNLDAKFRSRVQAYHAIEQAIETYNHRRLHTSLDYRTPAQVHQQAA
jgi:transposase InsO family protein